MNIYQKFWCLLSQKQKLNSVRLMLLTLIGAIFEAAGVGLIIPLISVITDPNFELPIYVYSIFPFVNYLSQLEIIIGIVALFIIFYLIKALFLLFLAALQSGYYYNLQETISTRLFNSYLNRPYAFHLKRNSAVLLSNTLTESEHFSVGFTSSALLTINDVLIIISILGVLLYVEPIGAIIAFSWFAMMSLFLFKVSKARALVNGKIRQESERQRIKSAQEGLNGIKDIKLYGREKLFESRYLKETRISLEASRRQTILQNIPRNFLEFVAVFALFGLVLFLYITGNQSNMFATVVLFAAAAFKLMPTTARLVHSSQTIVFNTSVVSFIYRELVEELENSNHLPNDMSLTNKSDLSFEKSIDILNLNFNYEGIELPALDTISLNIEAGKMIGFIGASGAGKSTLIDCLLCLVKPSSGEIRIDGTLLKNSNIHSWQKKLGYVSQEIYLLDGSLRDNIGFGIDSDAIDDNKIMSAIERSQLKDFILSLPEGLNTLVGERGVRLSGGQRQRIGIARALYNNPQVLVLDEATSALDTGTEREVMNAVEKLQGDTTVLIIAHRYSTIENCDYIYKLDSGRILACGKPSEVIDKNYMNHK